MEFGLSSEQRMLQDAVTRYLAEQSPLRHVRDIATAAKPYSKEQNGQTASIFAPTGMPLVFTGVCSRPSRS